MHRNPELYRRSDLFLTARSSDADKLSGFALGADDYITKPFNPLELAARIRATLKRTYKREEKTAVKTYSYSHFSYSPQNAELIVGGEPVSCSAQLLQLLQYFCEHPDVVLSKDQIYEKVWGYPSYGDNNTVMVHIRKLREKIEKDPSNPSYIVTVRGLGYRFIPDQGEKEPAHENARKISAPLFRTASACHPADVRFGRRFFLLFGLAFQRSGSQCGTDQSDGRLV